MKFKWTFAYRTLMKCYTHIFHQTKHTSLRSKLLMIVGVISLFISGLTFAIGWVGAAITWPSTPAGEADGGAITKYLYNIIGNSGAWKSCTNSGVVIWFDADGTPRCSSVSSLLTATSISSFTTSSAEILSWSPVTLSWSVTNATSCSATNTTNSNQWSGSKSVGISQIGSVSPTVRQNPTINSFTANSTSITAGSSTQLAWTTSNVTGWCMLNPGSISKWANDSITVTPTITTEYQITCTGFNNATVTSSRVTIAVNQPPSLTFQVNSGSSTSVAYNGSVILAWNTDATSCTATNFALPNNYLTSQSISLTNLTATKTYTLSCTGPGGPISKNVTVNVANPTNPTVLLTASRTIVLNGRPATLMWTTSNSTSCVSTNFNFQSSQSSSLVSPSDNTTVRYTITCTGEWNTQASSYVDIEAKQCFNFSMNTITGWDSNCNELNMNIPSSINGQSVTEIGAYAFYNKGLKGGLSIPWTVTTIDSYAFGWNNIDALHISSSVQTIYASAFENNNLTSLVLPFWLKSIDQDAFANNALTSIDIPMGIENIGSSAFARQFNKNNWATLNMKGPSSWIIYDVTHSPSYYGYFDSPRIYTTVDRSW